LGLKGMQPLSRLGAETRGLRYFGVARWWSSAARAGIQFLPDEAVPLCRRRFGGLPFPEEQVKAAHTRYQCVRPVNATRARLSLMVVRIRPGAPLSALLSGSLALLDCVKRRQTPSSTLRLSGSSPRSSRD
jgi:hypothetical protein